MRGTRWFKRLGDAPGITYEGLPAEQRSLLPGHDAVPRIRVMDLGGNRHEFLEWPKPDGSFDSNPVYLHWMSVPKPGHAGTTVRPFEWFEVLELPGTLDSYHFPIRNHYANLWPQRIRNPHLVTDIEQLCLLDLQVTEAFADELEAANSDRGINYSVDAFGYLIHLYERSGRIREALMVAQRAVRFKLQGQHVARLQQRLTRLEAEDAR